MRKVFGLSELTTTIKNHDQKMFLYKVEAKDIARGFCGALFLALPLHYTMEMWYRAKDLSPGYLVLFIILTYFINVGYCLFSGYKPNLERKAVWFDAFVSMAIGFTASAITMFLVDQLSWNMNFSAALKLITLEMIPTSFGASLAKSQLGARGNDKKVPVDKIYSDDFKKLMGSLLGAIMFSFNVAATQEPIIICTSISELQLIGIVIFSLLVSYLMVFMASFVERDTQKSGIMSKKWAETLICYCISLLVSAGLLVMFGYLGSETPFHMALCWTIVLGYCTSLGSAVGRLVIS